MRYYLWWLDQSLLTQVKQNRKATTEIVVAFLGSWNFYPRFYRLFFNT